jgi:excisionase family DNA binding protein
MDLPKLINSDQLSEIIGVRPATIYSWVRRGRIPHVRLEGLVRFDLLEIKVWLQERKKPIAGAA